MPVDKVALRKKLKDAGKKIPAWLQDKKSPPKQTEAQKKKKAKEAEMKRLKAQKAARDKEKAAKPKRKLSDIAKGGTKKKAAEKARKAGLSEEDKMRKRLEDDGRTYFKRRK